MYQEEFLSLSHNERPKDILQSLLWGLKVEFKRKVKGADSLWLSISIPMEADASCGECWLLVVPVHISPGWRAEPWSRWLETSRVVHQLSIFFHTYLPAQDRSLPCSSLWWCWCLRLREQPLLTSEWLKVLGVEHVAHYPLHVTCCK